MKRGCSPYTIFSCKATVTKFNAVMGIHRSLKENQVHRLQQIWVCGVDRIESSINWETPNSVRVTVLPHGKKHKI